MATEYVIVLVFLVVLAALAALPPTRQFFSRQYAQLRNRLPRRPAPSTGPTIPIQAAAAAPGSNGRAQSPIGGRQLIGLGALLLILLLAIYQLPRLLTRSDQFVVLVAPFQDAGGSIGQTGRTVAEQLAEILPSDSGGRVVARLIEEAPADSNAALRVMEQEDADALIWGSVTPGGMLNQESLIPLLVYRPSGAFAPAAWDGYTGRFAMPVAYQLSTTSLNGQAVLPTLLGALADYGAGEVDSTLAVLDALGRDYPALTPVLPDMLRGNILWARGEYEQAADAYQRASAGTSEAGTNQQAALLFNNLGAIWQDAGDAGAARQAFDRATGVLIDQPAGEQDLGELRFNLGIEGLRAGDPHQAIEQIEVARSLLPPSTPLLLTLSEAYQASGQFAVARGSLDAATAQVSADVEQVPAQLQAVIGNRLRAAIQQQRALLGLAQALQARGPLLWELQAAGPLPRQPIDAIRSDLAQSVKETEALSRGWSRRSAAEDAARHMIGGRIAIWQSQRAEALLRERQRWQAVADIQLWRAQGSRTPQGLSALWSRLTGDRSILGQARERLEQLAAQPADFDAVILLGHAYLLSDQLPRAAEQFDKAALAASQRPEPVYGQALVALGAQPPERERARELLRAAVALDEGYFPAREKLAAMAQEDGDWSTVVAQRRWLAANRPLPRNRLALAEALRSSGPAGYGEAERVLLTLVEEQQIDNANRVLALLELSRLYRDYGDPEGARVALERAQSITPRDPDVAYELGRLLAEQNADAEAEAQLKVAIDENPQHVQAHLALAGLYAKTGGPAAQEYRAALDAGASDLAALKDIGAELLSAGEYDAASSAYQRAIGINENDAELHHGLAQAYLGLGRLDAAQEEEQRALALKPDYAEALVGLGDIALRRGNPPEAVQHYEAAIAQNGELTSAYLGLGRAWAAQGNWSVAQAHYQSALRLDPDSVEARLLLGDALLRQDNADGAISVYADALKLKPDYAEAYYGISQAQLMLGQVELANENVQTALRLRPSYAEAMLLQGKLYEQQRLDDEAVAAYTRAIAANRQLAEPYYRRALMYIRRDEIDDARTDLEAATRIQPNFPEAHYWLGRTYMAQGSPRPAVEQFKLAVEQRGGNYPEARFYQGLAEEQLGLRDDAVASFRIALDQDRASAWVREAQAALERLGQR